MFQFSGFAPFRVPDLQSGGLPHSEFYGSQVASTSPQLIAGSHVLHRLQEPRHPPCALIYFLNNPYYLLYISIQYVKELFLLHEKCGEYRSRTDDPLLAKQVL
ncbi:MAG: hypothetical protein FD123_3057 [Bacteroidetes bacterium]|nr:MAG: hypothetical protein FD123_3057 [Bacteroidota bacterium]